MLMPMRPSFANILLVSNIAFSRCSVDTLILLIWAFLSIVLIFASVFSSIFDCYLTITRISYGFDYSREGRFIEGITMI